MPFPSPVDLPDLGLQSSNHETPKTQTGQGRRLGGHGCSPCCYRGLRALLAHGQGSVWLCGSDPVYERARRPPQAPEGPGFIAGRAHLPALRENKSPSRPPSVFLSLGIQLKSLPSCGSAIFSSAGALQACTNSVQRTPRWLISFLIHCVLPACSRNTKPLAQRRQCASESLRDRMAGRLKVGQQEGSMEYAVGNSGY